MWVMNWKSALQLSPCTTHCPERGIHPASRHGPTDVHELRRTAAPRASKRTGSPRSNSLHPRIPPGARDSSRFTPRIYQHATNFDALPPLVHRSGLEVRAPTPLHPRIAPGSAGFIPLHATDLPTCHELRRTAAPRASKRTGSPRSNLPCTQCCSRERGIHPASRHGSTNMPRTSTHCRLRASKRTGSPRSNSPLHPRIAPGSADHPASRHGPTNMPRTSTHCRPSCIEAD